MAALWIRTFKLSFLLPKNGLAVFTAQPGLIGWFKRGFEEFSAGQAGIHLLDHQNQSDQAERPAKPL